MRLLPAVAAVMIAASPATAQSLADRVDAVDDGVVRLSFTARPGVCGFGRNISTTGGSEHWEGYCESGPVRVVLELRDGRIVDADTYVGGRWRPADDVTDLGRVPAGEAARYFVSLAARLTGPAGKEVILPATLADSATVWPDLLTVAKDRSRPRAIRKRALFWVARAAGEKVAGDVEAMTRDEEDDVDVREHAVFVLSRLPSDRAVPMLLRIAREHGDPRIRKQAIFWLGRSEDPRALAFLEEILIEP